MPSLNSLFTLSTILLAIPSVLSNPLPITFVVHACAGPTPAPLSLPPPSLPESTLPPPSAGLVLKHITLGRGIQNYSCAAETSAPVATGALAILFDITTMTSISPEYAAMLMPFAAHTPFPISPASLDDTTPFNLPGTAQFPVLGHHYFSAAGTPTFDLSAHTPGKEILSAKKDADAKAPGNADKGISGSGAVAWLKLSDKGGSVGLKEVFRVNTAGGVAPATGCAGVLPGGTISVDYATQYWFYG